MKKNILLLSTLVLFLASCKKSVDQPQPVKAIENPFTQYTIRAGNQYCDQSRLEAANYSVLKFIVKFDSSAIYHTISPDNQGDINKLYGFSDNDSMHHLYSARFGWGWSQNALNLYAYYYNDGVRDSQLLGRVTIGQEHVCSIAVNAGSYIFTLDGKQFTAPRKSITPTGHGYKLFPYFGGDEVAPHDINIWIKEL